MTSIEDEVKTLNACVGDSHIGSLTFNEVFSNIGTPEILLKLSINL